MHTTVREQFALRFADCVGRLKDIGLKGSVAVSSVGVVVTTTDKPSASIVRRAVKKINADGVLITETRAGPMVRVFTFLI